MPTKGSLSAKMWKIIYDVINCHRNGTSYISFLLRLASRPSYMSLSVLLLHLWIRIDMKSVKTPYIYDVHIKGVDGGWRSWNLSLVCRFNVFKQSLSRSFLRMGWGGRSQNWSFLVDIINGWLLIQKTRLEFDQYLNTGSSNWTQIYVYPNFKSLMGLQSWTIYLEQSKETQSYWAGLESFDIYFCVFFDCLCQSLIFVRDTGRLGPSSLKFQIFLIFPNFLSF